MKVMTVQETARLLEVDERTVYRLIGRGELPAFKVGRQWRLRLSDIEGWIEGQLRLREGAATYQAGQLRLFEDSAAAKATTVKRKSGFKDSAFSENNGLPVHRWVPWIAGFSAGFVGDVLDRYSDGAGTVLDPFAGVGTTLVTAMLRGRDVCGFEINPYAAEACELKLAIDKIPLGELADSVEDFRLRVTEAVQSGRRPLSRAPEGFVTRARFFSPEVERKVLLVRDYVSSLADVWVRNCFRLALASELVGFSNYSYEPSLCRRATAGKSAVADAPVVDMVVAKLRQMLEDIRRTRAGVERAGGWPERRFYRGDFFQKEQELAGGSVQLVITSPPYLNNYHYIRNSRPQVYWLGLAQSPGDLKGIEQDSFGKYWQTVRGGEPVALGFQMRDLQEAIDTLRERNVEKGQYGGRGWANYAATYFNDSHRFAGALARLLRPAGRAVVVLGNSILQGVEFKTDVLFARICEIAGLRVEDVTLLREKRTGTSIVKSSVRRDDDLQRTALYESAVILSKPA